jgi:hypothetical protein
VLPSAAAPQTRARFALSALGCSGSLARENPNHSEDPMHDEPFSPGRIDRRAFLTSAGAGLAGAAGLGIAPGTAEAQNVSAAAQALRANFGDPRWNRDAFARLQADIDPTRTKYGWYKGVVLGVRPKEAVRPLVGFEGFSVARFLPQQPDGSWRKLLRETVFFRDLRTGQILERWQNPYTSETVRVVHTFNDPFNFTISEYFPDPPNYGGLNTQKPPRVPFRLPWSIAGSNTLLLGTDIHLFYPSALQPDKWPRESPGPTSQVSEMFRYVIRAEDMADPKNTSVEYHGTWNRVTPWLPWMLMGQAEGHILYVGDMAGYRTMDYLPQDLLDYCRKNAPKFLEAPTEDYGPSLSSIENFARNEKPAPVDPKVTVAPPGSLPPTPPRIQR